MANQRISFNDSIEVLKKYFKEAILGLDSEPYMPPSIPNHDDVKTGISFFRGFYENCNLDNLTLPRTYFGRSELRKISFRNTDLSESRMCWNDFIECDFTDANLKGSDLRNSIYKGCIFKNATLDNADLRHEHFENCNFSEASLKGAKLTKRWTLFSKAKSKIDLSEEQRKEIDWQKEDGEEAPGG
jgi:uncharacterized protein YjbI with pentapeptide repeats